MGDKSSELTCLSCSSARRLLSVSASKLAANKPLTAAVSIMQTCSSVEDIKLGCRSSHTSGAFEVEIEVGVEFEDEVRIDVQAQRSGSTE